MPICNPISLQPAMPTTLLGFPQSRKDAGEDPQLKEPRPLWQAGELTVLTLKLTIVEDDSVLVRQMEAAVDPCEQSRLVIGGFSLGARIALRVASRVRPAALLSLGFPFHPPRQPQALKGTNLFVDHDTTTLIAQGARDPHGTQNEAKDYWRVAICLLGLLLRIETLERPLPARRTLSLDNATHLGPIDRSDGLLP